MRNCGTGNGGIPPLGNDSYQGKPIFQALTQVATCGLRCRIRCCRGLRHLRHLRHLRPAPPAACAAAACAAGSGAACATCGLRCCGLRHLRPAACATCGLRPAPPAACGLRCRIRCGLRCRIRTRDPTGPETPPDPRPHRTRDPTGPETPPDPQTGTRGNPCPFKPPNIRFPSHHRNRISRLPNNNLCIYDTATLYPYLLRPPEARKSHGKALRIDSPKSLKTNTLMKTAHPLTNREKTEAPESL